MFQCRSKYSIIFYCQLNLTGSNLCTTCRSSGNDNLQVYVQRQFTYYISKVSILSFLLSNIKQIN